MGGLDSQLTGAKRCSSRNRNCRSWSRRLCMGYIFMYTVSWCLKKRRSGVLKRSLPLFLELFESRGVFIGGSHRLKGGMEALLGNLRRGGTWMNGPCCLQGHRPHMAGLPGRNLILSRLVGKFFDERREQQTVPARA